MEILYMDVVERKLYSHLRLEGIDNRYIYIEDLTVNALLNCITYLPENDANYHFFRLPIYRHYENVQKIPHQ